MYRAICCVTLFAASVLFASPVEAVLREWDDEGGTSAWSEAANWSDDTVPLTADDASIGTLADAFDDVVLFDLVGDTVSSLLLTNGADFDTNSGRLVMSGNTDVGTGAGSGTTVSELIVRPRIGIAIFAIDTNAINVGANGQLTILGGEVDIDGTGVVDGVLSIAAGGALSGYGLVDLSDKDVSLGVATSLLVNDGEIIAGDPQPVVGEPASVMLHITASQAPLFGVVDLGGSSALGKVSMLRNATLKIEPASISPERMTLSANAKVEMSQNWVLANGATIEINSGVVDLGLPTELPALPAVIGGAGIFSTSGTVEIDQADEELIIESRIDGIDGNISNRGVVRFRGGGGIRGVALNALDEGVMINESTSILNFQGGNAYNTPLTNEGLMAILEQDGDATVQIDSFTQTAVGTLILDLGGNLAGEFDVLDVTGDATLAGIIDIDLISGFVPVLGDSFEILTTPNGTITGVFDTTDLPALAGLEFDVVYNSQSVVLEVVMSAGGLTGDFDSDGDVDGADFLKWQRGESPDPLSATDLADWENNFGAPSALGGSSTTVPEPATAIILALAMLFAPCRRLSF